MGKLVLALARGYEKAVLTPITHVLLLPCHSQLLFKLCLFKLTASTRPDLVRVRVRFGPLFAPLPPSLAQLRRSQDTTRYDIDCVNRASTFSLSVCLSVCQSRTALFRSTYTVQGPLCPNREPC